MESKIKILLPSLAQPDFGTNPPIYNTKDTRGMKRLKK